MNLCSPMVSVTRSHNLGKLVRISRLNVLAILVKSAKTNLLSVPATNNLVAMGLGDRPQLEVKTAF